MAYLLGYNLGCPDKRAELYKKNCKKIVCNMNTFDKHFISVIVTTKDLTTGKLLSTTGYRPRLSTVYLCFTSSHGQSVCHEGKTVHLRFPPYKAAAPASPFFPPKAGKRFLKNVTS